MELNKAFIERVRGPIQRTWEYIGYDSMQLADECGERLTNSAAMEGCLDAGRISDCGKDPEADRLIGEAFDAHGWSKVNKYLCRYIKLV